LSGDDRQAIAKEYAKALFELASQQGQAPAAGEELAAIASLAESNREFGIFLATPAISREQRMQSLARIFSGRVSDLLYNFLMVMARRSRLGLLKDVAGCYQSLEDAAENRVRGTLTTAAAMEVSEQIRVHEQISRAMQKTVSLTDRVDPDIIGGMILTVGGVMMDGSVKRRLEKVAERMRKRGAKIRYEK
jgi:F-type H+-transporting ATPase subunit delta